MRSRHLWTCLLACGVVLAPAAAQPEAPAQEAATPERSDQLREKALFIIGRHINAVGGEELIRAIEDLTIRGTFEIRGAAFIGKVVSIRSDPPRMLTRLELGNAGTILQGFDGQTAWTINPGVGPALAQGPEATSIIRSADVHGDLHYEQIYPTIEFRGDEVFEGEPAFAIRLVDHDGTETFEFYSKGVGTRLGVRGMRDSATGPIPYTRVLAKYTEYERLLVPTTTIERYADTVITVSIKDVSFDRVDPAVFDLPQAVRSLVEAEGGAQDAPEDSP